jgi:hypothetical protein
MIWARRMDESPNPDKNEDPRARLDHFSPSGELSKASSEGRLEMQAAATSRTACPGAPLSVVLLMHMLLAAR